MNDSFHSTLRNVELEKEVLCSLLNNPGRDLYKSLRREIFTPPLDTLFDAMQALDAAKSLNPTMLIAQLRLSDKLDAVGGERGIAELAAGIPLPEGETFLHYAGELEKLRARRETLRIVRSMAATVADVSRPLELESYLRELNAMGEDPEFYSILERAAFKGEDFLSHNFPERERLVGDWFREGDLGFVFAPRGVGKTWFVHSLISALTSGRDFGRWKVAKKVQVCLLDGEMPPDAVQERLKKLEANGGNLVVLSHQTLYEMANCSFQLGESEHRSALLAFCLERGIDVLVIDNLSSMSSISENDNDEWKTIGDWLLDFRRNGISVVVVHHAGRNGAMRGASRREDAAFWIVSLTDSKERTTTTDGARFVSTFTKCRNGSHWPEPLDWHLADSPEGCFEIKTTAAGTDELVFQCIADGLNCCSEIAEALGNAKSTVSKAAKRLSDSERIVIEGKANQARYRVA